MIKFITLAVKTQLNVHDLNNEAVAGNVTDIRIMEFLNENGDKQEAPAVSGRMLKHWHYEIMRKLGIEQNLSFCDSCKIGEPVRPATFTIDNVLSHQEAIDKGAEEVVRNCIICDVHGFLSAIGTTSERRSSRVMFSWLMPVITSNSKQVIHSRVKSGMGFKDKEKELSMGFKDKEKELISQRPFSKSYVSGIYAFVSALDVERIGLLETKLVNTNPYVVNDNDRKKRIKVAIDAYRYLISGQLGASLSHALPHGNPLEILAIYSEQGPLPFPISPMYSDYVPKTVGLMPQNAILLYWGEGTYESITKKESINQIFTELLNKV